MSRPTIVHPSPSPSAPEARRRQPSRLHVGVIGAVLASIAITFGAPLFAAKTAEESVAVGLRAFPVDPLDQGEDDISVLVFTQTECPIARRYAPEIFRLQRDFAAEGVRFWLVFPDPDDNPDRVRAHLKEYVHGCAVALDPAHQLVARAGVTVTPEVAVFVGDQLAYRGRITDRETGFGKLRKEASIHDLADALDAIVSGNEPTKRVTEAVGCYIQDLL